MPQPLISAPLRVLGTGETNTVLPQPIKPKKCGRCADTPKKKPDPGAIIQQPQQVGMNRYTVTDDRLKWLDQYLNR